MLGYEPGESKDARAQMGVVPQLDNLDVDVTVEDNLAVFAALPGEGRWRGGGSRPRPGPPHRRRQDAVDKLSGGMRRRLLLARGLVHRPRLMLLDEPTVGLDPQIRTELWSLIDGLRNEGKTILMSTHYIEEAQRLADEVAVVAHGKVVDRGKPSELIAKHAGRETAEVYGPPAPGRGARRRSPRTQGAPRGPGDRDRRVGARRRRGARGRGQRAASLEDVFVLLTGEEAEQRLEPAAIGGVMSREVANFRTIWKTTTFSAVLEPVIYLVAFGLGLGATIVDRVGSSNTWSSWEPGWWPRR